MNQRTLGERLEVLMKLRDINAVQLAHAVGKTPSSIWHYIHDECTPTVETLDCLAEVLDCTTDELLSDKRIIRCQNCLNYRHDEKSKRGFCGLWEGYKFRPVRKPTDFCSRGKRI